MTIAYYSRLSSEKNDNISVENQTAIIEEFVKSNSDFCGANILHFVDSGFSGITMNRPNFQQMLTKVRARMIDVVIVKDFSRLSRNYLDVCRLSESIFPFMKVRLIAVSDCYDSNREDCNTSTIAVAFKAILSEFHVLETSDKLLKTYKQKILDGGFYGSLP
jgi:DNA invertase Pin-like site-specific DNA recombinase